MAQWTAQQVVDAFPCDEVPRFLMRDRDAIPGEDFRQLVAEKGGSGADPHKVCGLLLRVEILLAEEFFVWPQTGLQTLPRHQPPGPVVGSVGNANRTSSLQRRRIEWIWR